MPKQKVAYISANEPDTSVFESQLEGIDYELDIHICKSEGETIEAIKGADIIVTQGVPITRAVIQEIDTAQAILCTGHGFDRIDHYAATDKSVMVVNSAGFCTEEVANHAIMLLLACAKKLARLNDHIKTGKWVSGEPRSQLQLHPMVPIDGQTLGLVSFGNIARATARKAQVFGLDVIAYDPYVPSWIAKDYRVKLVSSMEELASLSDFVSAHVPLNRETEKMMGKSFFKSMKSSAYFINTCRGRTVDELALIAALQNGEIAGAGLDVFEQEPPAPDNPLLKMDNVIVTPHSAGTSDAAVMIAGPATLGRETANLLSGRLPMSLVNPEVRLKISARPAAIDV